MNRYVDPRYVINNLGDIFNENLGITLKDVYDIINTAPSVMVRDLSGCKCENCIYRYHTIQNKEKITDEGLMCDCPESIMYEKWINLSDVCADWEGE